MTSQILNTARWRECSSHDATAVGVRSAAGTLMHVWRRQDCFGNSLCAAHEAATEFQYEFGGHVVFLKPNVIR